MDKVWETVGRAGVSDDGIWGDLREGIIKS